MLLKFEPIPKKVVWGSGEFFNNFNYKLEPKVGELWILGSNNKLKGDLKITLSEFAEKNPDILYGRGKIPPRFPVLIKYISTSEWLSVQLHPDDEFARAFENEPWGKTEMWYFLSETNNPQIICGLSREASREEIYNLINSNSLSSILNYITVRKDEWVLIKSGVVHAIGPNISLLEIQMNSDLTYRMYDWGRVGLDGKPRELHIDKALKVIDPLENLKLTKGFREVNLEFPTFIVETIRIPDYGKIELDTEKMGFHIILSLESDLTVNSEFLRKYECALITASEGKYKLEGPKGSYIFLIRQKEG